MVLVTFVALAHPALATLVRPCISATTKAPGVWATDKTRIVPNNPIAFPSAAAGDIVADMVLDTTPRFTHARYAPDRFDANVADESWLRARVADAPSGYYRQANVSEEISLTEL